MPSMMGDKFVKAVLQINPDAKVIISTGFSGKVDQDKAVKLGTAGFIAKPFTKDELNAVIQNALLAEHN